MSDRQAGAKGSSRWDQARAWLSIVAALATVAAFAYGHAGVLIVGTVTVLQRLNLMLWRRDSASKKGGQERAVVAAGQPVSSSNSKLTRAEPLFLLEELAAVGTSLWALVLGFWATGMPVHPLMYAAMLLLVGLIVLMQWHPQLRVPRPSAAKRSIVRSSTELH